MQYVAVLIDRETRGLLAALRRPGESWDAAVRRWARLPVRVSRRRRAAPVRAKGARGRPVGVMGPVYAAFQALEPGQQFFVHYFGQRQGARTMPATAAMRAAGMGADLGGMTTGNYPPQPELLTAIRRCVAAAQRRNPGASFQRTNEADGYVVKRLT